MCVLGYLQSRANLRTAHPPLERENGSRTGPILERLPQLQPLTALIKKEKKKRKEKKSAHDSPIYVGLTLCPTFLPPLDFTLATTRRCVCLGWNRVLDALEDRTVTQP